MGAEPWINFVPYQANIGKALQDLREQLFHKKEFRWAEEFEGTSIDDLLEELTEGGGTASAIDMLKLADEPEMLACAPLSASILIDIYGTDKPTTAQVKQQPFFDEIERGYGYYVVTYEDGVPSQICFAGYSWD